MGGSATAHEINNRPAAFDYARTLAALPDFMRRQALQAALATLSDQERQWLSASLPPLARQDFHNLIAHIEGWA